MSDNDGKLSDIIIGGLCLITSGYVFKHVQQIAYDINPENSRIVYSARTFDMIRNNNNGDIVIKAISEEEITNRKNRVTDLSIAENERIQEEKNQLPWWTGSAVIGLQVLSIGFVFSSAYVLSRGLLK